MRALFRVSLVCVMVTFWGFSSAGAQDGLTKRNAQGAVTVAVTLMNPPAHGDPVKVKVALDTHSVGLDSIKFENAVALRTGEGSDVPPSAVEKASGSGHHREAVLVFPAVKTGAVRIVVKNVGGVTERSFSWELPAH